ncbi:MAG: sialate O-acetylesterase [Paludibacter sp.]|nr:sialate O-acetylesterase [Paludibacter sp.]
MKKYLSISIILLCLLLSIKSEAQKLQLGELFNEGAVLQRNSKVSIWGTSKPSTTISINIQDKKVQTKSDKNGDWKTDLSALKEGGPYPMTVISATDTVKIKEIYVGEVWIAGGQSNMAFMLEKSDNGEQEIVRANNTNIRFVMVPYKAYEGDKTRGDMNWRTATTENVSKMSAVAYYFAKDLQQKLNVPVGVICCYKGGSGAETWMTRESLLKNPDLSPIVENYESYYSKLGKAKYLDLVSKYENDLKQYQDSVKAGNTTIKNPKEPMGEQNYNRPFGLYYTMLKRVIPYSLKGAIWYQGEHNSPRAEQYRTLFPAMIEQWRMDFNNPALPFLFVQLPGYSNADTRNRPIWPELREAQLMTWQNVKNTGMAVAIDLGEKSTIHPPHKEPVGKRLAICAFNTVYGIDIPYSGPVYKNVEFTANQALLSFNFVYEGLKANGSLQGFTICGSNNIFVPAKAEIKGNQVVVWAEGITSPKAIRYGWDNWTEANLTNSADLPATPFRTDDFPLLTAGIKTIKYQ